jgi:hypothetical protein
MTGYSEQIMTTRVEASTLPISEEMILTGLGVPDGQAEDFVINTIREQIGKCRSICAPKASWVVFGEPFFNQAAGVMQLEGQFFQLNKIVANALKYSSDIAVFIGTCGDQVENYAKKLMQEGHSLEGLIVDLIGSEIAEGVAEFIHRRIEADMEAEGLKVTNRYSPGYCKWPVSDQQQLFRLFSGFDCGIQLTSSSLMVPIKSVSGMIGIGPDVKNRGYSCAICDFTTCIYRNRRP